MIHASEIAAIITDPNLEDNPVVECNAAFSRLTGYDCSEIVGRNCRFLIGPMTEPAKSERLRAGILAAQPTMVEITNYRKDGTAYRNAVTIAPVFGDSGKLAFFLGSQVEIPKDARSSAADRRQRASAQIERLTRRQIEVISLLVAGKRNKQIAYELSLSERTVKMHRAAILQATGLASTADIIRLAIEAGY